MPHGQHSCVAAVLAVLAVLANGSTNPWAEACWMVVASAGLGVVGGLWAPARRGSKPPAGANGTVSTGWRDGSNVSASSAVFACLRVVWNTRRAAVVDCGET